MGEQVKKKINPNHQMLFRMGEQHLMVGVIFGA